MSGTKEKMQFLSTARLIGILLVVFGHSYPFDVAIPAAMEYIRSFLYAFHMPLFIFISGFLAAGSRSTAGAYILKRGKRLLIPYFALSLMAFIPKVLVQQYLNDSVQLSIGWLLWSELIPRENVWGHFWYLPTLFFLGCFGALTREIIKKHRLVAVFVLTLGIAFLLMPRTTDWFAMEDIRKVFFYYVLGMVLGSSSRFAACLKSPWWCLGFPVAIGLYGMGSFILRELLIACMMIGFLLWIGTKWNVSRIPLGQKIERCSYTVFLLSWPAQAVVEVVANRLLGLPVLLCMAAMFAAGVGVPLICVEVIRFFDRKIPMHWLKVIVGI